MSPDNKTRSTMIDLVNEYQCPGCVNGTDTATCRLLEMAVDGCAKHTAGTMGNGGSFALGVPKGFNRFGPSPLRRIDVYTSYTSLLSHAPNVKTIYSLPVWKHLDKQGNTIIRWFSPRTNCGWSTVIAGDCRAELPTAVEITQNQVNWMD